MDERVTIITAAGGNGTAIQTIRKPLSRAEYEQRGKLLGQEAEADGAEQAGFLILDDHHFEMAGGEFCGNATRAAAALFAEADKACEECEVSFTVSGFDGTVSATVNKLSDTVFDVRCAFPDMPVDVKRVELSDGQSADVVDLGGIVHVLIEGDFPEERSVYEVTHQAIVDELGFGDRDAVGVIWYQRDGDAIVMHPVVWVRAVDTFFYEQSCGSGTIAVGAVTGVTSIVQPTGQSITVEFNEGTVTLQSEMEIVRDYVPVDDRVGTRE